jgi:hypothetical protein
MTRTLGRSEYRRFCEALALTPNDRLTPTQRARSLPVWMCRELIATPAATQKLRAWATTAPREWPRPTPEAVLVKLKAFGDVVIPHIIARTLRRLPAPVREYIVRQVTFVTVGATFAGYCGPKPEVTTPWLIVLGYCAQLETLIAHECSHAWLMKEPGPGEHLMRAFAHQTIHDIQLAKVPPAAMDAVLAERAATARDEREVADLLAAWGFPDL